MSFTFSDYNCVYYYSVLTKKIKQYRKKLKKLKIIHFIIEQQILMFGYVQFFFFFTKLESICTLYFGYHLSWIQFLSVILQYFFTDVL